MSDRLRSEMLRIASDLPAGNPTRRKLLSMLRTGGLTFRDRYQSFKTKYETEIRDALRKLVVADDLKLTRRDMTLNGFSYGLTQSNLTHIRFNVFMGQKVVVEVRLENAQIGDKEFTSREVTDFDPEQTAAWIWKNVPAKYKR